MFLILFCCSHESKFYSFQQMPLLPLQSPHNDQRLKRSKQEIAIVLFQVPSHVREELSKSVTICKAFVASTDCINYCKKYRERVLLLGDHPDAKRLFELIPSDYCAVRLWDEFDVKALEFLIWLCTSKRNGRCLPSRDPPLLHSPASNPLHSCEQLFSRFRAIRFFADGKHLPRVIKELAYWRVDVRYCNGDVFDKTNTLYEASRGKKGITLSANCAVVAMLKSKSPRLPVLLFSREASFQKNLWVLYRHLFASGEGNYCRVNHATSAVRRQPINVAVHYTSLCARTLELLKKLPDIDVLKVSIASTHYWGDVIKQLALACVKENRFIFTKDEHVKGTLLRLGLEEFLCPFTGVADSFNDLAEFLCRPEVRDRKVPSELRQKILSLFGEVDLQAPIQENSCRVNDDEQRLPIKVVVYTFCCRKSTLERLKEFSYMDVLEVPASKNDEKDVKQLALACVNENRFILCRNTLINERLLQLGLREFMYPVRGVSDTFEDVTEYFYLPEVLNSKVPSELRQQILSHFGEADLQDAESSRFENNAALFNHTNSSTVDAEVFENFEENFPVSASVEDAAGSSGLDNRSSCSPRCCDFSDTENHSNAKGTFICCEDNKRAELLGTFGESVTSVENIALLSDERLRNTVPGLGAKNIVIVTSKENYQYVVDELNYPFASVLFCPDSAPKALKCIAKQFSWPNRFLTVDPDLQYLCEPLSTYGVQFVYSSGIRNLDERTILVLTTAAVTSYIPREISVCVLPVEKENHLSILKRDYPWLFPDELSDGDDDQLSDAGSDSHVDYWLLQAASGL